MKLYAPKYYLQFHCIASRCRHSCCIGWEIDVDEQTLARYQTLQDGYGSCIRSSIDLTETPHFRLDAGERCPHLNDKGLCRIILSVGEAYLCEICREHPRFYHRTAHGMEVGLGMACEEACRIILTTDGYKDMIEIGTVEGEAQTTDFDPTAARTRLYALLSDRSVPYAQRLQQIGAWIDLAPQMYTDEQCRAILSSLEYLDEGHRALFSACYSSAWRALPCPEEYAERALAYFIFRHASSAQTPMQFRAAVGMALLCERLLCGGVSRGEDAFAFARVISEEIEYSEDNTAALLAMFDYDED